ncbi:hypothetical protein B296_00024974 [Ensete ventricosum]|uniref:CTP synthase n=1 Tax=Ensete ventricosum TaxID=4639 RepID=A0A426Z848_ENSVE|nr:hypothetical protein B296_00024974 [Ensete ventricosum]
MLYFVDFADPYLNTDAGTMSPFEHGEVFVLDDGGEVIRFPLAFYSRVETDFFIVQVNRFHARKSLSHFAFHDIDSGILGAGDIESMPFIEALGQFSCRVGEQNLQAPIAVIEFARSVMNLKEANSTEFDPVTTSPVVIFMPEVNPNMVAEFQKAGLAFVGKDETGRRMEIIELPAHPYFVGVQFHPEFKSRPGKPSAVFLGNA